ncbi:hypothetical protein [Streptomyces sp. YIM S03343]
MSTITPARRTALLLIAAGNVTAYEFRIGGGIRVTGPNGARIRADVFYALIRDRLAEADGTRSLFAGQPVSLSRAGRDALGTVTSNVRTANTRAHQVRAVGRQHADDAAGMGECTACGAVGEWNALVDLAPNAYGCAGRAPVGY